MNQVSGSLRLNDGETFSLGERKRFSALLFLEVQVDG